MIQQAEGGYRESQLDGDRAYPDTFKPVKRVGSSTAFAMALWMLSSPRTGLVPDPLYDTLVFLPAVPSEE